MSRKNCNYPSRETEGLPLAHGERRKCREPNPGELDDEECEKGKKMCPMNIYLGMSCDIGILNKSEKRFNGWVGMKHDCYEQCNQEPANNTN